MPYTLASGDDALSSLVGSILHGWKDRVTESPKIIDTDHAYIHEGVAFELSFSQTGTTSTGVYVFKTPATEYVHFRPSNVFIEKGSLTYYLTENVGGATGAAWASTNVPYNRNRISTSTAGSVFFTNTTEMGGTNTVIDTWRMWGSGTTAGAGKSGTSRSEPLEWVLKRATMYSMWFDSTETFSVNMFWYEESLG